MPDRMTEAAFIKSVADLVRHWQCIPGVTDDIIDNMKPAVLFQDYTQRLTKIKEEAEGDDPSPEPWNSETNSGCKNEVQVGWGGVAGTRESLVLV